MKDIKSRRGPLWTRTKAFALRVISLYVSLTKLKAGEAHVLGRQMLRSGTSVGAQYREACRARSVAEFTSKMSAALQELEETAYWFELLIEGRIIPESLMGDLQLEANELTAMFVSSINTAQQKNKK